jgi:predicted DNA-binding transcriptional regulator YafY
MRRPHWQRERVVRTAAQLARLLAGYRYAPSIARLADDLGVSKRTVYRYLGAFETAGWALPKWRQEDRL